MHLNQLSWTLMLVRLCRQVSTYSTLLSAPELLLHISHHIVINMYTSSLITSVDR
jgi:hypothetical protein